MTKFTSLPSMDPDLPVEVCTEDGEFRIASIYPGTEIGQLGDEASMAVGELFAEVLNRLPEIAALPGFAEIVERARLGIGQIVADDDTPAPRT